LFLMKQFQHKLLKKKFIIIPMNLNMKISNRGKKIRKNTKMAIKEKVSITRKVMIKTGKKKKMMRKVK